MANNYVDNQKLLDAIIEHKRLAEEARQQGKPLPRVSNYIGNCFLLIGQNLVRTPKFGCYSFKEEMVSAGVENCLKYIENFDPNITKNPFAYFTQIIYYACLNYIKEEKKEMYVRYKSTQQSFILDDYEYNDMDDDMKRDYQLYDNISEFIDNYEKSIEKNKEKKKNKAAVKKGLENMMDGD